MLGVVVWNRSPGMRKHLPGHRERKVFVLPQAVPVLLPRAFRPCAEHGQPPASGWSSSGACPSCLDDGSHLFGILVQQHCIGQRVSACIF